MSGYYIDDQDEKIKAFKKKKAHVVMCQYGKWAVLEFGNQGTTLHGVRLLDDSTGPHVGLLSREVADRVVQHIEAGKPYPNGLQNSFEMKI